MVAILSRSHCVRGPDQMTQYLHVQYSASSSMMALGVVVYQAKHRHFYGIHSSQFDTNMEICSVIIKCSIAINISKVVIDI